MSLWTPGGEHEVPREQPSSTSESAAESAAEALGLDPESLDPEQLAQAEAMARELAEARERLLETPAAVVIANHAMGLYELGAIHLSAEPPQMAEAKDAIDAMAGLLDGVKGRLGENEATLAQAVSQLQMAFVQMNQAGDQPADGEPGTDAGG